MTLVITSKRHKQKHYSKYPVYNDILALQDAYTQLPFENVRKPKIAQDIAYLGAFYAYDFAINALSALAHVTKRKMNDFQRDASGYQSLLHFVEEECATDNILGSTGGVSSHFFPMLDAARATGAKVKGLTQFYQSNGADVLGLPSALQDYSMLHTYRLNADNCLMNICIRENAPPGPSKKIVDHLPSAKKYDAYRNFLNKHIAFDTGTDGHGAAVEKLIKAEVKNPEKGLYFAKSFLEQRYHLYKDALTPG